MNAFIAAVTRFGFGGRFMAKALLPSSAQTLRSAGGNTRKYEK
jgi:hypothetical protein